MDKIRAAFNDYFANFGVTLPATLEKSGWIRDAGWSIKYVILKDDQGQPVLEFLAEHRMTNPHHVRISADGKVESLESFVSEYSHDPSVPGDEEAGRERMKEHNRRVTEELRKKGLIS